MKTSEDIAYFELDRPSAANAIDLDTAERLLKTLKLAEKKKAAGLIIFTQNQKVFSSGGDLKNYSKLKSPAQGILINRKIRKIIDYVSKSSIITVAAVGGDCIGGGLELALACDFILSSANARFRFAQVLLGLTPGWGGMKYLLRRLNYPTALNFLASGRWINTQEAYQKGLVDQVSSQASLIGDCQDLLHLIAKNDTQIVKGIKNALKIEGKNEEKLFESLWGKGVHKTKMANLKSLLGK